MVRVCVGVRAKARAGVRVREGVPGLGVGVSVVNVDFRRVVDCVGYT